MKRRRSEGARSQGAWAETVAYVDETDAVEPVEGTRSLAPSHDDAPEEVPWYASDDDAAPLEDPRAASERRRRRKRSKDHTTDNLAPAFRDWGEAVDGAPEATPRSRSPQKRKSKTTPRPVEAFRDVLKDPADEIAEEDDRPSEWSWAALFGDTADQKKTEQGDPAAQKTERDGSPAVPPTTPFDPKQGPSVETRKKRKQAGGRSGRRGSKTAKIEVASYQIDQADAVARAEADRLLDNRMTDEEWDAFKVERRARDRFRFKLRQSVIWTSFVLALVVPLGLLFVDLSVADYCRMPSPQEAARMRMSWSYTWLASTMVGLVACYLVLRKQPNIGFVVMTVITFLLWRFFVMILQRVAGPICQGLVISEPVRHSAEMPLYLASALAYLVFAAALFMAARFREKFR